MPVTVIHRANGVVFGVDDAGQIRTGRDVEVGIADMTVTLDETDETITETITYRDVVFGKGTYTKADLTGGALDALREPARRSDAVFVLVEWDAA